jgi:trigger factor
MQIVRKDTDSLNITLDLTLEPSDYTPKFESEIKKYKNQAQLKGFRKGMTPISVIKKMYGKAILSDIINETIQEKLFGYLDEQNLNYLGQPLPNRENNLIFNLDVHNPKEYKFSFDLGLAPEIALKGVSENDEYNYFDVTIPDSLVDEEVNAARRRFGKRVEATDDIQLMDMIKLSAEELDGEVVKEGGWKTEFTILVDIIHNDQVKKELLTKKLGDVITFDIYTLEDKDKDYINKYILKKPEDNGQETGNMFTASITEISRIEPAELNEEFFSTFGDEKITDETSVREFLRKDIKTYYDNQSLQFLYREIMDFMMDNNNIDLPEDFLKRYLKETNENISDEVLEKEFESFAKNMRWSLQKSHLAKEYEIEVTEEDLKRHFTNSVFSYMRSYGNMDYSFISQTVERLMKDKEQVNKAYEEILADRVFSRIGDTIKKKKISITQEDFVEKVKQLNQRVNNL